MRRYETIFIVDPDLPDQDRQVVSDKTTDIVTQFGGFVVEVDDWGNRKLAYEIKKKRRGYYIRLDYCGTGEMVDEIERFFRIDDRVMKFMTVLLDKEVDVDQLKAELEQQEAAKAASEQEAQAAADAEADAPSDVPVDTPAEGAAAPTDTPQETTDTEEK